MKIAELKQICNRPDVVEVHSCSQLSEPAASSFIFADKIPLRMDHLSSSHISFFFQVQVWDATAADPKLLVYLKAYRNTVPVPRHWSQKRKFLQVCDFQHIYLV